MIISVHIPKTAGTSFRCDLRAAFGARLLEDYGDWTEVTTAEAEAHNGRRHAAMLAESASYAERFDVIHGHFSADKYRDVFPDGRLVTFVRDPYQHAMSSYEHAVRETRPIAHPSYRAFRERNMTMADLIEAVPDHQSRYFASVPVDEFAMIGLTERYEASIALFERMFGITMPRVRDLRNANPNRPSTAYAIPAELRTAVERHRAADLEIYRRAAERFDALCGAYEV